MKKLLALLLCLVLSGCATVGTRIEQDKVQQIKEGVTTAQEAIALLGEPFSKTITSDGKVIMMYQYTKVKSKPSNFIPIVNILSGGVDMEQQILQILINQDGVVEKYILSDTDSEIKSGLLNTD